MQISVVKWSFFFTLGYNWFLFFISSNSDNCFSYECDGFWNDFRSYNTAVLNDSHGGTNWNNENKRDLMRTEWNFIFSAIESIKKGSKTVVFYSL